MQSGDALSLIKQNIKDLRKIKVDESIITTASLLEIAEQLKHLLRGDRHSDFITAAVGAVATLMKSDILKFRQMHNELLVILNRIDTTEKVANLVTLAKAVENE